MLLGLMRKHAKSWLIKVLIGIIAFVFILYFGSMRNQDRETKLAYVNDNPITEDEYEKAYRNRLEMLKRQYKDMLTDSLLKTLDLENNVLEELIQKKIIDQEAKRIGLIITEQEIQEEILRYPAFQSRGRFDENRYRALLNNERWSPADFEDSISQDLLNVKLMQFLETLMPVSSQEVHE